MILDTNAVSALFVGDPALGKVLAVDPRHHLPVVVIGEYRYGLLASRHRAHLEQLLETLIRESFVLPVEEATAEAYSHVRDDLRRKGRPIPENDIWISALARQHGLTLVARDAHFAEVENLPVKAW